MVECELGSAEIPVVCGESFNRYMVECELMLLYHASPGVACFNRYMVECEYSIRKALLGKIEF